MDKIQVKILNPWSVSEGERMAACAARLTQTGEKVSSIDDFMEIFNKEYSDQWIKKLASLPHPTLQKFSLINVVIVGASRRFLAQITRHQNEVKFMSASLQYSDYSGQADFVVPYEIIGKEAAVNTYLQACSGAMQTYEEMTANCVDHDSAGYIMPQGLRNVLIMSATPYQWKHIIGQRVCRRNTQETRYVLLKIWHELYKLSPVLFNMETTGPFCMRLDGCKERYMSCGYPINKNMTPAAILKADFPKIVGG